MTIPSRREPSVAYMLLIATIISTVALGTDIILPAMDQVGREFALKDINDAPLVVSVFFFGMAFGQLFVGPLSDALGRKPVIIAGFGVFILGCVLSAISRDWTIMLLGRCLQGLGAAAPRVVAIALVRDEYKGRIMARIMSMVMAAFIIVPVIAPGLGQLLVFVGGWRATMLGLIFFAVPTIFWFVLAMPETLPAHRRSARSIGAIWSGLNKIIRMRQVIGYTIASGFSFGLFLGYLSSSQQIFQTTYNAGTMFSVYFGIASLSIGAAALVNARLVMIFGMRRLTILSCAAATVLAVLLVGWIILSGDARPAFWLFFSWLLATFFFIGIMFGNLTALSMEPLDELSGLGSAVVGSVSTFMSLPLGWAISDQFDGTVLPLVLGFALLHMATLLSIIWTERIPAQ